MDGLTIVRRIKNVGSSVGHGIPLLRLDMQGRFVFTKKANELLELKKDDGFMVGLNYKQQKAFLFKENEPDSFRIRERKDGSMHFSCKPLMVHFMDCFKISLEKKQHFLISKSEKGFEVTIKQ